MKRFFAVAVIIITFGVSGLKAQVAPNLGAIRDSIYNTSSRFYYPDLMARYQMMDSTLTLTDYHYLYYGYPEQDTYMPLLDNSAKAELENIMGKRTTPTIKDYERAIVLAQTILKAEPFNLRDINALAYLYAQTGNDKNAEILMQRVSMICETIMSSGTGLTEDSPWWITYFNHALDLLAILNYKQEQPIILSRTVEFIPVSNMPNKRDKGCYFNYSEIYAHGSEYMNDIKAPKRKMEFNSWEQTRKFRY